MFGSKSVQMSSYVAARVPRPLPWKMNVIIKGQGQGRGQGHPKKKEQRSAFFTRKLEQAAPASAFLQVKCLGQLKGNRRQWR